MEDKELQELIEKETKDLAEKSFLNGTIVGWNACLFEIKKEISSMTSAKKIKKFIDKKINESQERIKYKKENNNDKEKE